MPAKKSVNLEKALTELEKLVEEMEQGNLSLCLLYTSDAADEVSPV